MSATITPLTEAPRKRKPGRPKGCRCPLPCPIHPEKTPPPDAPALQDGQLSDDAIRAIGTATGADPARDPSPRRRKASGKRKPPKAELEAMLGELLSLPALPAAMILHCGYCANHFATEGPNAAKQVVGLAEQNPALMRVLVRMHEAWTAITWGTVLATYIGKPVLHHVAPAPMLAQVGPLLGVPPRPEPAPPSHAHPHVAPDAPETTPNHATAPPVAA